MVFRTEPHIERAKALIEKGDVTSLRYACLELRLALERIAYQKLQLRLSDIGLADIAGWQPKRVMDTLMELVDPDLDSDFTLSMGQREGGGDPETDTFTPLGTNKGINPRDMGKHWQRLGHFLHMSMPKKKGDHPQDPQPAMLIPILEKTVSYIEDATSTKFDSHFSTKVNFTCGTCKQLIVRNAMLLKEGDVVQCQNTACDLSYIAHKDEERFSFEPYLFRLQCKSCDEEMSFDANRVLKMSHDRRFVVRCQCGARHQVQWTPQYDLLNDGEESGKADA